MKNDNSEHPNPLSRIYQEVNPPLLRTRFHRWIYWAFRLSFVGFVLAIAFALLLTRILTNGPSILYWLTHGALAVGAIAALAGAVLGARAIGDAVQNHMPEQLDAIHAATCRVAGKIASTHSPAEVSGLLHTVRSHLKGASLNQLRLAILTGVAAAVAPVTAFLLSSPGGSASLNATGTAAVANPVILLLTGLAAAAGLGVFLGYWLLQGIHDQWLRTESALEKAENLASRDAPPPPAQR